MNQSYIDITVIAAERLKNVNIIGKMNTFVDAWIDPQLKKPTRILQNSGHNPVWNDRMFLPLEAQWLYDPNASLTFQVLSAGPLTTKIIGSTMLRMTDISRICAVKQSGEPETFTLQLWRPSRRAHGILRVSIKVTGHNICDSPCIENLAPTNAYDVPVQGIPVASVYPPVSSESMASKPAEYTRPVEQCPYYNHFIASFSPSAPPMKKGNAYRNFFIGLLSGAVAAGLVGKALL
eukprot:Gb_01955 [translate_table: standard]